MSRNLADRPGLVIFVGGVALVLSAMGLCFFLAAKAPEMVEQPLYHQLFGVDETNVVGKAPPYRRLLWSVPLLMWMVFGLGACLTLIGLRQLTRPDLDSDPSKPLGSVRDVFEGPE